MGFSVGDFAEQLIAQDEMKGGGALNTAPPTFNPVQSGYSPEVGQQAPDISNIVVPNDFVNSIAEGKAPTIQKEEAPVETPQAQPLTEVAELRSLVSELKELVAEVKQFLSEATTVGSIGVNMANTKSKDTKKDDDDNDIKKLLRRIKSKK
tara:strand:+ start:29 stop:481 length:453 start_codon:yes stop_codon:yes gene_type:complete